jgi:hypothetical protein
MRHCYLRRTTNQNQNQKTHIVFAEVAEVTTSIAGASMMANKPTNRTMSEVMLHGVLNMPPELWNNDSPIDVAQRHSRYVEASKRIYELEEQLQQAHEYADRLVEHKDMVCLPADLANLRAANAHFAIENHDLKERCDKLEQQLAEHKLALQTGDIIEGAEISRNGFSAIYK